MRDQKDASEDKPFSNLFARTVTAITLPHLSVEIKRVFTSMNYVE